MLFRSVGTSSKAEQASAATAVAAKLPRKHLRIMLEIQSQSHGYCLLYTIYRLKNFFRRLSADRLPGSTRQVSPLIWLEGIPRLFLKCLQVIEVLRVTVGSILGMRNPLDLLGLRNYKCDRNEKVPFDSAPGRDSQSGKYI